MLAFLTSRLTGPIASVVAVVLACLLLAQCSATHAAASRADKAESARRAAQANYDQCVANGKALTAAIDAQSARVRAVAEESAQRLAEAEDGLQQALRGRQDAEKRAARLLGQPPAGIDACARATSAFGAVRKDLR